jgi:hypothetical protein
MRNRRFGFVLAAIITAATPTTPGFAQQPHNVILFVADGLRPGMVNEQTTPALVGLMKKGVHCTKTHAMFPTFTTPNAASMATGHKWATLATSVIRLTPAFPCRGPGRIIAFRSPYRSAPGLPRAKAFVPSVAKPGCPAGPPFSAGSHATRSFATSTHSPASFAVQLDQVEGVEEHAPIVPSVADVI